MRLSTGRIVTLDLYFDLIPQAKQSARFYNWGGRICSYQKGDTIRYQENISWFAKTILFDQYPSFRIWQDRELRVTRLDFVFPAPSGMSKANKQAIESGLPVFKHTKPDLHDNLCKAVFDALEGVLYDNDSRICELHSRKIYGNKTGIYLTITDEV